MNNYTLGEELTLAVLRAEGVSAPSSFHLENTAAFIHRMDPAAVQTAAEALPRTIRVQIITPPGALTKSGQKQLVNERGELLAPECSGGNAPATSNCQRFAELGPIRHPTLVVNGVHDEMIPVSNSYRLSENLPNAVLLTYPDAGHGSLFQYPEAFTRHAAAFLSSDSESAAF
jgi:pimeloyl-ACP methyl ester carboxylesterase